jgi:hypothetical protein
MLDTLPPFAINTLDKIIAWIYSFQPIFEPTVVLGKYDNNSMDEMLNIMTIMAWTK